MNASNVSAPDPWFYNESWNWFTKNIFVWLFPLVCIVGAGMNACAFFVIATNRKAFPYVTRQYMLIMTINSVITLSLKASTHYLKRMSTYVRYNPWTWYQTPRDINFPLCIVYDFFTNYSLIGAPFFQLGLTIDRLIAVAFPLKAKQILTKKRSWILLLVITAMVLFLPIFFVTTRTWNNKNGICDFWDNNYFLKVYQPFELYFGGVFLFSALILGTASICILLCLNNRTAQKLGAGSRKGHEQRRSLIRITLILIFTNVAFLITCLPISIVTLLMTQLKLQMGDIGYRILYHTLDTVSYANSALTWPSYFMGSNFRRAFFSRFAPRCLAAAAASQTSAQQCRTENNTENREMARTKYEPTEQQ